MQTCTDVPSWQCGSLEVPLDWEAPNGRKLQIHFSVRARDDLTKPSLGTVVGITGGPGYSAMQQRDNVSIAALRPRHDFLFLDQRGSGAADPVVCQDLQDGWSSVAELRKATTGCGDQLGDASDRYGSGDAARDLEAVRARLDLPAIDILAFSYGTVVAEAYVARYPERVHALVVDGGMLVTDREHRYAWDLGKPRAQIKAIELMCSRDLACAQTYPDPGALLEQLIAKVHVSPLRGSLISGAAQSEADEADIVRLIGAINPYGDHATPNPLLKAATAALKDHDPKPMLRMVSDTGFWPGDQGPASEYSAGLGSAAYCNDQDFVWDRTDPIAVRERKLGDAISALPADAFEPVSVSAWMQALLPEFCLDWPAPDRFEPVIPAGVPFPDTPVLATAGDLDGVVPSTTTRAVAEAYPNGVFAVIPGRGHTAVPFPDNSCAQLLVAGFFETLKADAHACDH